MYLSPCCVLRYRPYPMECNFKTIESTVESSLPFHGHLLPIRIESSGPTTNSIISEVVREKNTLAFLILGIIEYQHSRSNPSMLQSTNPNLDSPDHVYNQPTHNYNCLLHKPPNRAPCLHTGLPNCPNDHNCLRSPIIIDNIHCFFLYTVFLLILTERYSSHALD